VFNDIIKPNNFINKAISSLLSELMDVNNLNQRFFQGLCKSINKAKGIISCYLYNTVSKHNRKVLIANIRTALSFYSTGISFY